MVLDESKYTPSVYKYLVKNKEKIYAKQTEYMRGYYEANKEKINERRKESQKAYISEYRKKNGSNYDKYYKICDVCGRNVNTTKMKQHLNTKIHQNSLIKHPEAV